MKETDFSFLSEIPKHIWIPLNRELLNLYGRRDAINFALDCRRSLPRLRSTLEETKEQISNPIEPLREPMKPGASPRLFKDGFLKGLEDVIELITSEGATAAAGYDTTVEPFLLSEMKQTEGPGWCIRFCAAKSSKYH